MVANARASASDKSNATTVANASACSEAITASINACTSTKGNSANTSARYQRLRQHRSDHG